MTERIFETPKTWLNLELCKTFYDRAPSELRKQQPLPDFFTRFPDRLESILGSVRGGFAGVLFYPSILDCASGYLTKINCGHPFSNGNKRLSIYYTDLFLYLNGIDWRVPVEDAYILATRIAIAHDDGKSEDNIMSELQPYFIETCFDAYVEDRQVSFSDEGERV